MVSIKNSIISTIIVVFVVSIFALTLRGQMGNPNEKMMASLSYINNNPMELSHERAYFALTYAMLEHGTFQLSTPLARFSTPDVAYINGGYFSLFAPGVSFLIIPGYLLGKAFGMSQLGSFAIVALGALINGLLIYKLARLLGISKSASAIGALVYLFATPSFAYEVSLYQHQFTVLCILLSVYILIKFKSWWSVGFVWLLIGAGVLIDSPNVFLMAPLGVYAMLRWVGYSRTLKAYVINLKLKQVFASLLIVIPALVLIWYNTAAFGLPFSLSGSLPSVDNIDSTGKPVSLVTIHGKKVNVFTARGLRLDAPAVNTFFVPRDMINGAFIEIISNERGIFYFTPVLFLAIFGLVLLYRKDSNVTSLLIALVATDLVIYTMWGDPWGGWAFGARYLIPAYSILAIGVAAAVYKLSKNKLFVGVFFAAVIYSVLINTLGALTTNKIPPRKEAISLEKQYHTPYKYTYSLNIDELRSGKTLSFAYNTFFSDTTPLSVYYWILSGSVIVLISGLTLAEMLRKKQEVPL